MIMKGNKETKKTVVQGQKSLPFYKVKIQIFIKKIKSLIFKNMYPTFTIYY